MTWESWRDFANNSKGLLKVPHCHWEVWSNLMWQKYLRFESTTINSIWDCEVHLFFQCGVAWSIKLVPISSSWTGPLHNFVKDAWWQKILVYEQHELKLMWTHVQFAWWWYLELRRDRDVICGMRYKPNLVLGWIVVELISILLSPLKKTFESPLVLVPLREEEDSLLSLVSRKQLLSLPSILLVGL